MKILALTNRNSACDYHRIILPLRYIQLEKDDEIKIMYSTDVLLKGMLEGIDIIIFNRIPIKEIKTLVECRERYGFKLVMDLDDYWKLYQHHYLYKNWQNEKIEERIIEAMKVSDLVIVTNTALAEMVKNYNKKVEVVCNALPISEFDTQFEYNHTASDKVRILFSGGKSHYYDIKSIEYAFDKCKSDIEIRNNCEFILAGVNSKEKDEVWTKTKNIVDRVGNLKIEEMKPLSEYMRIYDSADIVLAPLENNNFNKFKSNLKIIEAGCKRIPIICTAISPYIQDMFCKGIFLCQKPGDWYEKIKKLSLDEAFRKESGEILYEYVLENYNLKGWNQKRYQILKNIIK